MATPRDVLIADDDRLVSWVVKEWVEETGRAAFLAENAVQALQLLKSRPAIQVLVTDLRMPVMDGNQLIREALKLRPDLKIVIMTGYINEAESTDRYQILEKPFRPSQLADALARVCGNGVPN